MTGIGTATVSMPAMAAAATESAAFFDLLRTPDRATAYTEPFTKEKPAAVALTKAGEHFQSAGIDVETSAQSDGLAVTVTAPMVPLVRVHLRWQMRVASTTLCMGDAWERSYGDLAWRTLVPERVMPWYFAVHAGGVTHGYGVRTGAGAMCFWQVDAEGVSLWLDLSNGGNGVMLGQRTLAAATVLSRRGREGESPLVGLTAFCRQMCPRPRLPAEPVYGTNDWYYAYGRNTAQGILRDTELVASLAPAGGPRPFSVIDMGWENKAAFPDMVQLAAQIKERRVRPGIWIRPLEATKSSAASLLLPQRRFHPANDALAYDPTIPEALEIALTKFRQVVGWKYELIKHDFSTWDLLGQWGFEMGPSPAVPGWNFHDRTKTNAEIILDLYKAIRVAAGETALLLGCNTVAHLAAGIFEMQRTGDDTSGREWERTRRMGVNTLAYRLPQHRTFFDLDADCVGITKAIPWELNAQWMDLIARSGTGLFLSPSPDAVGPEQRAAIKQAFAIAASGRSTGYAVDWLGSTVPEEWMFAGERKRYAWGEASPFLV